MSEKEEYLDQLLKGLDGESTEEPKESQQTEDEFLESYEKDLSDIDEDEFLREFEKNLGQPESDFSQEMSLEADSDRGSADAPSTGNGLEPERNQEPGLSQEQEDMDVDSIVHNVKQGTYGQEDSITDGDLSIEESLLNYQEEDPVLDEIGNEFSSEASGFTDSTKASAKEAELPASGDTSDKDILDMLSGMKEDSELSDIGDLLNKDQNQDKIPADELDTMAKELAEEINSLNLSVEEETAPKKPKREKKEKVKSESNKPKEDGQPKKGFFKRLGILMFGEEEVVRAADELVPEFGDLENISDENLEILKELEGKKSAEEEEKKLKKKEEKEEKAKARAEKKAKREKEKKEKPKKEKKPKVPEPVMKTRPLPKGPVVMIMLMGISIVILVVLLGNMVGYSGSLRDAKDYYAQGKYTEASACLSDETVKKADKDFYRKVRLDAFVQQQINLYETYQGQEMYIEALGALISGVARYDRYAQEAGELGASAEFETMLAQLEEKLSTNYGMTLDQARELYNPDDKKEFTFAVYDVVEGLGLTE